MEKEELEKTKQTLKLLVDAVNEMQKEVASLRTDVDRLIENSCGYKKSA